MLTGSIVIIPDIRVEEITLSCGFISSELALKIILQGYIGFKVELVSG